jgi:hypothetical protein
MTNEETDTALILENELKRRVNEVVERVVVNMVGKIIHEELNKYKAEMLMEVSIAVGKMLRVVESEGRKPLWETDFPVDIKHAITKADHAIRE